MQKQQHMGNPPSYQSAFIITDLIKQYFSLHIRAFGPSMNPTISNGDLVQMDAAKIAPPKIGSIVLFPQHERLILHRIIRFRHKRNIALITGDAALKGYATIPVDDILATARCVIRNQKTIRLNTRSARYFGLIFYFTRPLRRLWFKIRLQTTDCRQQTTDYRPQTTDYRPQNLYPYQNNSHNSHPDSARGRDG